MQSKSGAQTLDARFSQNEMRRKQHGKVETTLLHVLLFQITIAWRTWSDSHLERLRDAQPICKHCRLQCYLMRWRWRTSQRTKGGCAQLTEASAAQTLASSVRHRLLALRHLQADELLSGEEASQIAVNIVTSLFTQPDQPTQQNTPRTESAQRSMAMGSVRTNTC